MNYPDVSVVMAVRNGGATLQATLESVLSQEGCHFEFIVVNDGSTDQTGDILDAWAKRDPRLRILHQINEGLTRSLMRGCSAAVGEFIARQDCGDVSCPGRLSEQLSALRADAGRVLVACGARYLGPAGENLFEVTRGGESLHEGLLVLDVDRIKGPPHHGAVMFRRSAYVTAGGYRATFVVAQDLDLWLRLSEIGRCFGLVAIGYCAAVEERGISSLRRVEQFRLASLAIECARLRRSGRTDAPMLLAEAGASKTKEVGERGSTGGAARANYLYFVGSCLRASDPLAARKYFAMAVRANPLFLRAWARRLFG